MVEPNAIEFLESWSAELESKSKRVRQLIGDAHWLSDGAHKETIIRNFTRRYLPDVLSVGHGFVKNRSTLSKEQDILITDLSVDPAFLREGDFLIVPSTSVLATMEIKSSFTKDTLKRALSNVASVIAVTRKPIFTSICFCSVSQSFEKFIDITIDVIGETDQPPTIITSLSDFCCFMRVDDKTKHLRFFDSGPNSLGIAIIDLIDHVRAHFGHQAVGPISELIDQLEISSKSIDL